MTDEEVQLLVIEEGKFEHVELLCMIAASHVLLLKRKAFNLGI